MLIFLVSFLPLIIVNAKLKIPNKRFNFNLKPILSSKKSAKKKEKSQYIIDDDNWEIISEKDAISGKYYID